MTVWPQSQSDSSLLEDEGHEGAEDEGEGEPWAELCPGPGARDDGARPTVPSPRIHQYITPSWPGYSLNQDRRSAFSILLRTVAASFRRATL